MKKHRLFSTLLQNQKSGYELIMTSVLIAIGVNLLSTGIVELLGFKQKDLALVIIGIVIFYWRYYQNNDFKNKGIKSNRKN